MIVSDGAGDGWAMRGRATDHEEPGEATLDRVIQSRIGEQLRAMYDGLMEQPVPDRFHALLARLEDTEDLKDDD